MCALLFGLGSWLADGEARPREVAALLLGVGALLALALASVREPWQRVAIAAAAVGLGAGASQAEALRFESSGLRRLLQRTADSSRPRAEEAAYRLLGRLRGDAREQAGRLLFVLDLEALDEGGRPRIVDGRVRVEVAGTAPRPRLLDGDRIAVWARLRVTERGGGLREGIGALGWCKSARLIEPQAASGPWELRAALARLRDAARRRLQAAMAPGRERGLVLAMTLGDRSELDEETSEAFRASGTYHVLALSGAQVALVAGLLVLLLRWLLAPPWVEAGLAIAAVACYAALVGGDLPVVRAVLMAAALLVGRALELDTDAANLLGLAALVLLVQRPAGLGDVGFQLSFGATLGILLLARPLAHGLPRLPLRVELAVASSIAAQATLAPVLAASFHRLAPAAVLLNIAAVPLSTAVLLAGLGVLAASFLGAGPAWLAGLLAGWAARALRWSGDLGPLSSWLDLRVPGPSAGILVLHLCGLALVYRGRRCRGLAALLAAHLLLIVGPLRPQADGRLHMVVIDVGQGDSVLLHAPSGRALLVDAGTGATRERAFDAGERRVAPELWQRRLRGLDALVVTHAHEDHLGGARFLLRAFRVAEAWEGPAPVRDPGWRRATAALASAKVVRRSLAAGAALSWEGVRLSVVSPRPPPSPPARVRNEDSLVLELSFGSVRLLLTGDLAGEAERMLAVRSADVLKVPHHGSASSSSPAFVSAVRPRLAIVSCGGSGAFGSARPEVVGRYADAGALVLRTDRDGTVDIATDGSRLWLRSAREPQERRIR